MLRPFRLALCTLLLVGCQMAASDDPPDTSPINGGEISVTPLDAPADGPAPEPLEGDAVAEDAAPEPPVPEADPAAEPPPEEEAAPAVVKSSAQIDCERRGGTWARAGISEARTCVKQTRDGGKQCSKGTQCEGLCLARSGTCAPVTPLFGCHDILEDDGRRVTLCID
jgi:hypothetical protein